MRKVRIGARLGLSYGLLVVAFVGVAAFGLAQQAALNAKMEDIVRHRYALVAGANGAIEKHAENARITVEILLLSEIQARGLAEPLEARQKANSAAITAAISKIEKGIATAAEKDAFARVTEAREPYLAARERVKKLFQAGLRAEGASALTGEMIPRLEEYRERWQRFVALQEELMQKAVGESERFYATQTTILVALVVLVAIVAAVFGTLVTRGITRPLSGVLAAAECAAARTRSWEPPPRSPPPPRPSRRGRASRPPASRSPPPRSRR